MKNENPNILGKVKKGARLKASEVNSISDAINYGKGTRPIKQVGGPRLKTKGIQMLYKSAEADKDYIICRTWDGDAEVEGDEDILVARPFCLRYQTERVISGNTITYTYTTPFTRVASNAALGLTENQVVTEPYVVDDLIYVSVVNHTDVFDDDDNEIYYIDDNKDGRAWAREITP